MSTSTYFYVDYSPDPQTQQFISLFTYNYLVHPTIFNRSNKTILLHTPLKELFLKPLDWEDINTYTAEIDDLQIGDFMSDIWNVLQGISFTGSKYTNNNCIFLTSLQNTIDWDKYLLKFDNIFRQINNINITIIDTSTDLTSETRESNISRWNKFGKVITLTESIQSLTKWGLQVSKLKKPVEVYGYKIDIMEMFDFTVSVYPYTKKNLPGDYITVKTVSTDMVPVSYKYEYEEEGTIVDGFKYGRSIITDLPSSVFVQEIEKCFSITGFVRGNVPPWYLKNESVVVWPSKKADEKDIVVFNELWSSMVRQKVYATVRFVKRQGADVKHGVLFPKCYVNKDSVGVDNGVFIFVETVFKDYEKLVSVPNLMNIEPKYDFDSIIDDMNLDTNEKLLPLDYNIVTMNEDTDMFANINPKQGQTGFYKTVTNRLLQESNPIVSIERLIYLSSYLLVEKNRESGGGITDTLADISKREGIPAVVVEKWLKTAKTGVFKPNFTDN